MAGKKKKKRPKFQPPKYDWVKLESDYLAGEIEAVKEFFKQRAIPQSTYSRKAIGWGLKRQAIRAAGNKIIFRGLARDYADAMRTHLNWGAGAIKLALDALVPTGVDEKGFPKVGLKPTTAAEAVKILHLGTVIQKNALLTTASLEEMLRDKSIPVDGEGGDETKRIVNVIIDLPSNGKEAKGLTGQ